MFVLNANKAPKSSAPYQFQADSSTEDLCVLYNSHPCIGYGMVDGVSGVSSWYPTTNYQGQSVNGGSFVSNAKGVYIPNGHTIDEKTSTTAHTAGLESFSGLTASPITSVLASSILLYGANWKCDAVDTGQIAENSLTTDTAIITFPGSNLADNDTFTISSYNHTDVTAGVFRNGRSGAIGAHILESGGNKYHLTLNTKGSGDVDLETYTTDADFNNDGVVDDTLAYTFTANNGGGSIIHSKDDKALVMIHDTDTPKMMLKIISIDSSGVMTEDASADIQTSIPAVQASNNGGYYDEHYVSYTPGDTYAWVRVQYYNNSNRYNYGIYRIDVTNYVTPTAIVNQPITTDTSNNQDYSAYNYILQDNVNSRVWFYRGTWYYVADDRNDTTIYQELSDSIDMPGVDNLNSYYGRNLLWATAGSNGYRNIGVFGFKGNPVREYYGDTLGNIGATNLQNFMYSNLSGTETYYAVCNFDSLYCKSDKDDSVLTLSYKVCNTEQATEIGTNNPTSLHTHQPMNKCYGPIFLEANNASGPRNHQYEKSLADASAVAAVDSERIKVEYTATTSLVGANYLTDSGNAALTDADFRHHIYCDASDNDVANDRYYLTDFLDAENQLYISLFV